jgi:hydroxyacylglutathione hydrolase
MPEVVTIETPALGDRSYLIYDGAETVVVDPQRDIEVPAGEVWVHCASGFRASIGASILDRAGRQVVYVDDDWENAARFGLPLGPRDT